MAAEEGKVDPMHQFSIHPMFGTDHWEIAGYNIAFTKTDDKNPFANYHRMVKKVW